MTIVCYKAPKWLAGILKIFKKRLAFSEKLCYTSPVAKRRHNIRVWRSLVSRLNGVQEAAGSNPVTRTKSSWTAQVHDDFFMLRIKKSSFTCSVTPPLKLTIAAAGLWFCFQFQQLIYSVHMAQAKGLEIERFRVLF